MTGRRDLQRDTRVPSLQYERVRRQQGISPSRPLSTMYALTPGAHIMQECHPGCELCAIITLAPPDRVSYMRIVTLAAVNGSLNLVYSPGFYSNLVDEVNRTLEPLFLEFRQMMSEDDGQPVCAIVSLRKCFFSANTT